jgi:hypothetical protein
MRKRLSGAQKAMSQAQKSEEQGSVNPALALFGYFLL